MKKQIKKSVSLLVVFVFCIVETFSSFAMAQGVELNSSNQLQSYVEPGEVNLGAPPEIPSGSLSDNHETALSQVSEEDESQKINGLDAVPPSDAEPWEMEPLGRRATNVSYYSAQPVTIGEDTMVITDRGGVMEYEVERKLWAGAGLAFPYEQIDISDKDYIEVGIKLVSGDPLEQVKLEFNDSETNARASVYLTDIEVGVEKVYRISKDLLTANAGDQNTGDINVIGNMILVVEGEEGTAGKIELNVLPYPTTSVYPSTVDPLEMDPLLSHPFLKIEGNVSPVDLGDEQMVLTERGFTTHYRLNQGPVTGAGLSFDRSIDLTSRDYIDVSVKFSSESSLNKVKLEFRSIRSNSGRVDYIELLGVNVGQETVFRIPTKEIMAYYWPLGDYAPMDSFDHLYLLIEGEEGDAGHVEVNILPEPSVADVYPEDISPVNVNPEDMIAIPFDPSEEIEGNVTSINIFDDTMSLNNRGGVMNYDVGRELFSGTGLSFGDKPVSLDSLESFDLGVKVLGGDQERRFKLEFNDVATGARSSVYLNGLEIGSEKVYRISSDQLRALNVINGTTFTQINNMLLVVEGAEGTSGRIELNILPAGIDLSAGLNPSEIEPQDMESLRFSPTDSIEEDVRSVNIAGDSMMLTERGGVLDYTIQSRLWAAAGLSFPNHPIDREGLDHIEVGVKLVSGDMPDRIKLEFNEYATGNRVAIYLNGSTVGEEKVYQIPTSALRDLGNIDNMILVVEGVEGVSGKIELNILTAGIDLSAGLNPSEIEPQDMESLRFSPTDSIEEDVRSVNIAGDSMVLTERGGVLDYTIQSRLWAAAGLSFPNHPIDREGLDHIEVGVKLVSGDMPDRIKLEFNEYATGNRVAIYLNGITVGEEKIYQIPTSALTDLGNIDNMILVVEGAEGQSAKIQFNILPSVNLFDESWTPVSDNPNYVYRKANTVDQDVLIEVGDLVTGEVQATTIRVPQESEIQIFSYPASGAYEGVQYISSGEEYIFYYHHELKSSRDVHATFTRRTNSNSDFLFGGYYDGIGMTYVLNLQTGETHVVGQQSAYASTRFVDVSPSGEWMVTYNTSRASPPRSYSLKSLTGGGYVGLGNYLEGLQFNTEENTLVANSAPAFIPYHLSGTSLREHFTIDLSDGSKTYTYYSINEDERIESQIGNILNYTIYSSNYVFDVSLGRQYMVLLGINI